MRRCTACFRFQPGRPTYCAFCGRSFDVRLCPRGHRSPRHVSFCAECGSSDLSTATPPPSPLFRFSGWALYGLGSIGLLIVLVVIVGALLSAVDWQALVNPLLHLLLMLAFLYWTTTLLPGPVKKVGRMAGRQILKTLRKNKNNDYQRKSRP